MTDGTSRSAGTRVRKGESPEGILAGYFRRRGIAGKKSAEMWKKRTNVQAW